MSAGTELALWVEFLDAFALRKDLPFSVTGRLIEGRVKESWRYAGTLCKNRTTAGVAVTFNAVDVNFDSASLYFVKNNMKIQGIEGGNPVHTGSRSPIQYAPAIHTLSSPETIKNRQSEPPTPVFCEKIQNYPTFFYRFALACADFENIVFVIDGLYQKGERLPPLKVRMKYADFSQVPKYTGSEPVE